MLRKDTRNLARYFRKSNSLLCQRSNYVRDTSLMAMRLISKLEWCKLVEIRLILASPMNINRTSDVTLRITEVENSAHAHYATSARFIQNGRSRIEMHAGRCECCDHVFTSQLRLTNQNVAFGHPAKSPLLSMKWIPQVHLHAVVLTEKRASLESNSFDKDALEFHFRIDCVEIMSTFQILEEHRRQRNPHLITCTLFRSIDEKANYRNSSLCRLFLAIAFQFKDNICRKKDSQLKRVAC